MFYLNMLSRCVQCVHILYCWCMPGWPITWAGIIVSLIGWLHTCWDQTIPQFSQLQLCISYTSLCTCIVHSSYSYCSEFNAAHIVPNNTVLYSPGSCLSVAGLLWLYDSMMRFLRPANYSSRCVFFLLLRLDVLC